MLLLMMNSNRAKPNTRIRQLGKVNASWGLPTFIMILVLISGSSPRWISLISVSSKPS